MAGGNSSSARASTRVTKRVVTTSRARLDDLGPKSRSSKNLQQPVLRGGSSARQKAMTRVKTPKVVVEAPSQNER